MNCGEGRGMNLGEALTVRRDVTVTASVVSVGLEGRRTVQLDLQGPEGEPLQFRLETWRADLRRVFDPLTTNQEIGR